jgi:hypothetical protein
MPGRARHDVEEREGAVVLVDLVARELAAQDLGEDIVGIITRHGRSPGRTDFAYDINGTRISAMNPLLERIGIDPQI